jgi:hypothetical protein
LRPIEAKEIEPAALLQPFALFGQIFWRRQDGRDQRESNHAGDEEET